MHIDTVEHLMLGEGDSREPASHLQLGESQPRCHGLFSSTCSATSAIWRASCFVYDEEKDELRIVMGSPAAVAAPEILPSHRGYSPWMAYRLLDRLGRFDCRDLLIP